MFQSLVRASFCMVAGVLLQGPGCLTVPLPEDSGGSSVDRDHIRVRFLNQSNWALDVQFYATGEVGDAETVLFLDANQVTAEIGLAGRGLILAWETDEIVLLCDNARTIGTRGGDFLNAEGGESAGTGEQRVFVLGEQYNCEETITIVYRGDGDTFETSYLVD